jgi:hypothetical protein
MKANDTFGETVFFEFLHRVGAEQLCERLRLRWFATMSDVEDTTLVAVELGPGESELALLLEEVQRWVGRAPLGALRFHLDGRPYVLTSAVPGDTAAA